MRRKKRITLKEAIKETIQAKLKDRPILVWYDPERSFDDIIQEIGLRKVKKIKFDGSYLKIRVEIEDEDPELQGKWLIYVSETPPKLSWLRDYELAGARLILSLPELCYKYQETPLLFQEIKELLKGEKGRLLVKRWDQFFDDISKISKDGVWEALLASAMEIPSGLGPGKIITTFLEDPRAPEKLDELGLEEVLRNYAETQLGLTGFKDTTDLTSGLSQALFLSELVEYGKINKEPYKNILPEEHQRRKWADWLRDWMKSGDPKRIEELSRTMESDYDLKNKLTGWKIVDVMGIPCVDEMLLNQIEALVQNQELNQVQTLIRDTARKRAQSPWNKWHELPWDGLTLALQVMEDSEKTINELKSKASWSLYELFENFKDKWSEIDKDFLILETQINRLPSWAKATVAERAFGAYRECLDILGQKVADALGKEKIWKIKGWKSQDEVLSSFLDFDKKDFAIILVDALRLDLAQRLKQMLEDECLVKETPTLASLPSITPVGMGSLIPMKELLSIKVEKGKLIVDKSKVDMSPIKKRRELWSKTLPSLNVLSLDELEAQELKSPKQALLVTSQEIDLTDEDLRMLKADTFGMILERINKTVKKVLEAGYKKVIIASDHGFLWISKDKTPQTLVLNRGDNTVVDRRYAIGNPEQIPDTVRLPLSTIRLKGDGDIVFPKGLKIFSKQGPISSFLHGGYLPQETALLTLVVQSKVIKKAVKVQLLKQRIDTLIPIFTVRGESSEEYVAPRTVRVMVFCEGKKIGNSENIEIQAPGEEKRTNPIKLKKPGNEILVRILDVHTKETLDEEMLEVVLPERGDIL